MLCSIFAITMCNLTMVSASENKESKYIPEEMEPYTEIEYINESEYKVLKGGSLTEGNEFYNPSIPLPQKGMKVQYASDGKILNILEKDGLEPDYSNLENLADSAVTTRISLPNIPIWLKPFATWGATPNSLYRMNGNIVGIGRATTYSDAIGQRDARLGKGDVATKQAYDDCAFGITVYVTADIKGTNTAKKVAMTKKDVGGMPDAVVDIWKTGVEYWGYSWNSWFSIPGLVTIEHQDR